MADRHVIVVCPECRLRAKATLKVLRQVIACPRCRKLVRFRDATEAPTEVLVAVS